MAIWESRYKIQSKMVVHYFQDMEVYPTNHNKPDKTTDSEDRADFKYSKDAAKRFKVVQDNFSSMFTSISLSRPDLLFHSHKGKIHNRKPVFITLTIPKQNTDDQKIKRKALDNLLQNLTKNYTLKTYLWKAEAQERGDLHFHCVFDAFIHRDKLRQLWARNLRKLNCIPKGYTDEKLSRLVWLEQIDDISTMAAKIEGYFEGERDNNGQLIHKHDDSKRVRDINGRSWGCSDNLRYPALAIYDTPDNFNTFLHSTSQKTIYIFKCEGWGIIPCTLENGQLYWMREGFNGVKVKTVFDLDGDKVAEVFMNDLIGRNSKTGGYYVKKGLNKMDKILMKYHLTYGCLIYGGFNDEFKGLKKLINGHAVKIVDKCLVNSLTVPQAN